MRYTGKLGEGAVNESQKSVSFDKDRGSGSAHRRRHRTAEPAGKIAAAQNDLAQAQAEVAAQKQINADLADAVENSGDPDRQTDIARDKLGLVEPGEYVFYFTD